MKIILDTHCHTISSGHAYSSLQEMVMQASNIGHELIAITDHGPDIPGGAGYIHFSNLRIVPKKMYGVEVLKGAEANIIDLDGTLDLQKEVLEELEFVIASFHDPCITPGTKEENTSALINNMKKPYVHAIGHPGNPNFPLDIEKFVKAAKEYNTLIEINNSSIRPESFRKGSKENCYKILKKCKEENVAVTLGSDAHISFDVGNFSSAKELIKQVNMPEELIVNTSVEKLKKYISK